jgi:polyisoprenoid-binding protein YceI
MLEVSRFAQIRFTSTAVTRKSGEEFEISGSLVIRNVSKPVTFAVTARQDGAGLRIRGKAVVRIRDFDRKPPTAGLGTVGTRNEMDFTFDILAIPKS